MNAKPAIRFILFAPVGRESLLLKRMNIPAGARWITVHPHGDKESKGVPVLIQPVSPGSDVHRVIGGAGGKLNYMKIRGLKTQEEYAAHAKQRRAERQVIEQQQRQRDKELGVYQSKAQKKTEIAASQREQENNFVERVAQKAGWGEDETRFKAEDYTHLTPRAYQTMQRKHHGDLVKKAEEFVQQQHEVLLADHDKQAEVLGGVTLKADPAKLSVDDLNPVKTPDTGMGFAPAYAERAAEAAGGKEKIEQAVQTAQEEKEAAKPEEQKQAAIKRKETAEALKKELENQRGPELPKVEPGKAGLAAADIMDLLKEHKALKKARQQAESARKKLTEFTTPEEVKAYNVDVGGSPVTDDEIAKELVEDMHTVETQAFLSEIGKATEGQAAEQAIGHHVAVGATNAANAVGLTLTGQHLVDRSVLDVLGIEGAARAIARRLADTLEPGDLAELQQAMGDYHVDHYTQLGKTAIAQAQAEYDQAKAIELGEAEDGDDLASLQELNRQRVEHLANARKTLGVALGEFEFNAALNWSLKSPKDNRPVELSLGKISLEAAIHQLAALNFSSDDYTITGVGGNQIVKLNAEALDKVPPPMDRDAVKRQEASLAILQGRRDEEGWLPAGVAKRPDLAIQAPPGTAPALALPFDPGREDLGESLADYIGGRTADGDAPADILADLLTDEMMGKAESAGHSRATYRQALEQLAPVRNDKGKLLRAEDHTDRFQALADQFVARQYGGAALAIHRQDVPLDKTTADALHRALAAEPSGPAAFKPIGDLQNGDQRALRKFFEKHVARDDPKAADLRKDLATLDSREPEQEVTDMFGETHTNPDWQSWKAKRDDAAAALNAAVLNWPKYVDMMRGRENAYAAMQDMIRSRVCDAFASHYNTLRPKQPVKVGRQVIRGNLNHLDAVDPEARAARQEQQRQLIDSLRERIQGKYASGSVIEKLESAREAQAAMAQNQMGFFGTEEEPDQGKKPLAADERHTLGHVMEHRLAGMMNTVGKNFRPGKPIRLWEASMSGRYAPQQRAVKYILQNKRVMLAAGAGSGKTLVGMGAFTQAKANGEVKRGIFAVPSAVQDQFQGEALRYLEPGKYQWFAEPGASREARIAALKDPKHDFVITTHQALRDDLLYLGAQREGIAPQALAEKLDGMKSADRAAWMKDLLAKEGIHFDFSMVDEGHSLLNRANKENSAMANVIDALGHNSQYHVLASADPIKNDPTEIHDVLQKLDPDRYPDRDEFVRRYGPNTQASKDALRREILPYFFVSNVDTGVQEHRREEPVDITEPQKTAMKAADRAFARLRLARIQGKVDVEAAKMLNPRAFAKAPANQHAEIARRMSQAIGVLKDKVHADILNTHPEGGKLAKLSELVQARKGKPGVVFAHNRAAVQQIKDRLEKDGHKVVTLTGSHSAQEKAKRLAMFQPDGGGTPQADVLVMSDAGEAGINAQRGQWLVQFDTPLTAKSHNQRRHRINRIGQTQDVETIDLVANHPSERAARRRLADKYDLRDVVTSPLDDLDDTGLAGFLNRVRAEQRANA